MIARILLSVLLAAPVFAQQAPDIDAAMDAARAQLATQSHPLVTAAPAAPDQVVMADEATRNQFLQSMRAYYDYRTGGYQYRARVFEWQLWSSRVIFMVVVLLVFAGMYFAAVQFHVALSVARRAPLSVATDKAEVKEALPLATQLEISGKGIVVNSSILGVIILVLSLAFFYLYLVYVYPIKDVF